MDIKIVLLFLLLVFLSQPALAHHKRGHQIIDPFPSHRKIDCEKLSNGIFNLKEKIAVLIRIIRNHPKQAPIIFFMLPKEVDTLRNYEAVYSSMCKEV